MLFPDISLYVILFLNIEKDKTLQRNHNNKPSLGKVTLRDSLTSVMTCINVLNDKECKSVLLHGVFRAEKHTELIDRRLF